MARDNEGQTLREYGNRKKRYRRRRALIVITLLLILVIAGGIYLYRLFNKSYDSYQVMKSVSNMEGTASGYLSYGGEIVKYGRDGAIAIDKNGNTIWNGAYEMANPIADTSGKYVAIADKGNRTVCVFDRSGVAGGFTTLHNIVKIEVASQGVVAVQMEEGNVNYIIVYEKNGKIIYEKMMEPAEEGYPVDIALSEDGRKMVLSSIVINSGKLTENLGFFNFGEVGQSYRERLVGGYSFNEDILIPRVVFLNNDKVCIYKDNGLILYSFKEKPDIIKELPQHNPDDKAEQKIKSIIFSSEYAGIVWDGEGVKANQLVLYDLEGNKVLDKSLKFEYSKISMSGEEILMQDGTSCVILKINGKEKFRYTFDSNVDALYPINHLDRYFLVNSSEIAEIKLED